MSDDGMSTPPSESSLAKMIARADLSVIASLAEDAYLQLTYTGATCVVNPAPRSGVYHVAWLLDFDDGTRWVFRAPLGEWGPQLERRMRSDIVAMRLIQKETTIPIPHIFAFSHVVNNPFGMPYMIMERVEGMQLSNIWFEPSWFTDARRRTVFESLATCMAQLRKLKFDSIGCLDYDPRRDAHFVTPLLACYNDLDKVDIPTRGPYPSVHSFLSNEISLQFARVPSKGFFKPALGLLRLFAGALPDERLDGPPFVLSLPQFDFDKIFVDADGNVTGIIGWDELMVGPRQSGYARYPAWLARDWDPLRYGRSPGSDTPGHNSLATYSREEIHRDPPDALQAFRDEYLEVFQRIDPVSAQYTKNSDAFKTLEDATLDTSRRANLLERLARYVFGPDGASRGPLGSQALEKGVAAGEWLKSRPQ